ncbi:MAG: (2Fe-2S)-binding protein [Pseudomonadales bacterium]|nr:(2Fe-2S)-binding protein [Pseudomonadales bacterium]
MPKYKLEVNGIDHVVDVDEEMPLLWALRDELGLTGTKYGCGIAQCGACTVHIGGTPARSCSVRVSDVSGQSIRTIEGLSEGTKLHPLQQAWIEVDVAQCGYCQAGQIMSAAALLKHNSKPTDEDIDNAMSGNYCRCGTYKRIRKAIHTAANYHDAMATVEKQV